MKNVPVSAFAAVAGDSCFLERQCRLDWARATAKLVQKHCFFNRMDEPTVTCFTRLMAAIQAREVCVLNTFFSEEEIVDWGVPSEEETCDRGTTCDDVDSNVDPCDAGEGPPCDVCTQRE